MLGGVPVDVLWQCIALTEDFESFEHFGTRNKRVKS